MSAAAVNRPSLKLALAALASLALLLAVPAGKARADGPRTPFVVARGTSLYGLPWRIRMGIEPSRQVILRFTIGDDECGCGYFSSFPLPVPAAFTFQANSGSGIDAFPEADTSGYAGFRVKRLVATMSDGSALEVDTQVAPPGLRKRFPWLRGLRFFDLFYPQEVEPTAISAYGRDGHLLERQPA